MQHVLPGAQLQRAVYRRSPAEDGGRNRRGAVIGEAVRLVLAECSHQRTARACLCPM